MYPVFLCFSVLLFVPSDFLQGFLRTCLRKGGPRSRFLEKEPDPDREDTAFSYKEAVNILDFVLRDDQVAYCCAAGNRMRRGRVDRPYLVAARSEDRACFQERYFACKAFRDRVGLDFRYTGMDRALVPLIRPAVSFWRTDGRSFFYQSSQQYALR